MMTTAELTKEDVDVQIQKLLLEIDELPSIPETLMEILRVLDDPDSGPSDLGDVVRLDAPLMARILRLANSPYYSSRGDIADIKRCVSVLGYRTVRQVAICVSVATSVITAVSEAGGQLDYRELWRHSVVTGAISKYLGKMAAYGDPEELFTAGLLHDMGKFVLEIHAPEIYGKMIHERKGGDRSLVEMEDEVFGFNHGLLGEAFGRSWRFPELLTRCCGEHHWEISSSAVSGPNDKGVAIIALADYLANTLEPPRSDLGFEPSLINVDGLHQSAGFEVNDVEAQLSDIRECISRASAYLDLA